MNIKTMLVTCALSGSCFAAEAVEQNAQTAEVAASKTMSVFILKAQSAGWGAGKAIREIVTAQEGVKSLKLSGLRATIVMNDGHELDADKLKKAMSGGSVSFVSLEKKEIPVPKSAYTLAVTGSTWAVTNDKARAALEKLPNVSAAYVNDTIEVHLANDGALDEKAVKEALTSFKIEVDSVAKQAL